jgi:hypothetical protein
MVAWLDVVLSRGVKGPHSRCTLWSSRQDELRDAVWGEREMTARSLAWTIRRIRLAFTEMRNMLLFNLEGRNTL